MPSMPMGVGKGKSPNLLGMGGMSPMGGLGGMSPMGGLGYGMGSMPSFPTPAAYPGPPRQPLDASFLGHSFRLKPGKLKGSPLRQDGSLWPQRPTNQAWSS